MQARGTMASVEEHYDALVNALHNRRLIAIQIKNAAKPLNSAGRSIHPVGASDRGLPDNVKSKRNSGFRAERRLSAKRAGIINNFISVVFAGACVISR